MIIHFGLHLDGLQPQLPANAVGDVTAGPSGLLDILETQLGLPPVLAHPGEAVLAYRGCLAEADTPARFYHRSFEVDPISVARTLNDWRSQWYEAGWDGTFPSGSSVRLADMAEVEALAAERVPLNRGQRLRRIAAALEKLRTQIERIVLHDEPAELPGAWHTVLKHFDTETAPGLNLSPGAETGTDLHRVQGTLLAIADEDEGEQRSKEPLAKDGSLIVVRGVSRDLSAQAVGEYLLKHGAPSDTVVIAEKDGIILDNAFERVGLPRAGFQHYSRFRAVNQVLKLALALLWEPVSPRLMLQFLVHPVGPLPLHARSTLAEAVAQQPGVGGQAWQLALRRIAVRQKKRFGDTSPAVRGLAADIAAWLDCERYSPLDGAPIEALIARSQRCASWLVARLHVLTASGDQTLFSSALGQAEALIESLARLKEQGHERLPRIELERLLDEVTGGSHDPDTFAEAAHARAATHPSLITAPWHTVIWWDLSPQAHEVSYPWSKAELAELAASGVRLVSMEARLKQRTRQWLRPIVNATARLMLIMHDTEAGYHPLWNQLTSLFDGLNEVRLDQTLFDGTKPGIPVLLLGTQTVTPKPLPRPKRWWELPPDCVLKPNPTESYSSLDKLIYYPHQWVLTYPARLRAGRAVDLVGGNLLAGNLAHRLFQDFFDEYADWYALDESAITAWLAEALQRLIRQEGAVLFEPGRGVDRERVAAVIHDSFRRLLAHLKSADVEAVAAEYPALARYKNIQLGGAIDLLLRTRRGREVVLDVKWGGEDRRGEALQDNRHLQLAIYAYLRKAASRDSRWPPQAYFIVSTGNILAQDADVFPDAVVFPPDSDEGIEGLWRRASHSFDWRWTQLAKGLIEVNAEGTEPHWLSGAPEEGLETNVEPDFFDGFRWLTGWEDGQ